MQFNFRKEVSPDVELPDGSMVNTYQWGDIISDLGETMQWVYSLDLTLSPGAVQVICWKYGLVYLNSSFWTYSSNKARLLEGIAELAKRTNYGRCE